MKDVFLFFFFFSSRRRHTRYWRDWSSDVCSSDLSVGGNLYSVPDGTRRRPVEVQVTATEVQILEAGRLIAAHPVLDGRGKRRIAEGHRTLPPPHNSATPRQGTAASPSPSAVTSAVTPRSLAIYETVGRRLAARELTR